MSEPRLLNEISTDREPVAETTVGPDVLARIVDSTRASSTRTVLDLIVEAGGE